MQMEQRSHRHFQVGQKKAIAGSIPPLSLLAASILCMLTAAALLTLHSLYIYSHLIVYVWPVGKKPLLCIGERTPSRTHRGPPY